MFGVGDGRPEDPNKVSIRGLFTRRRYGDRRRPVDELLNSNEGEVDVLAVFKTTTPYYSRYLDGRPVHTCCSLCFPESRKKVAQNFATLPVRNCFNVKMVNTESNWFMRYFANLMPFVDKKELASRYNLIEPVKVIQNNPNLFSYILEEQDDKSKDTDSNKTKILAEEKDRALSFLDSFGIRSMTEAKISCRLSIGQWLAHKYFASVFDGVCVHDGQMTLLKSLQKNHPVIYVPLHKSHWDHFVLSTILVDSDMMTPLLIAQNSLLQHPILGALAKWTLSLGCRPGRTNNRKKPAIDISPSSHESISVAHDAYVTALLKEGMSLEFSVEKHRSRTGKPGTVFFGTEFFSLILKLVRTREIEDALIVPVTVNYEKCPEENFINNYSPQPKSGLFRHFWNLFFTLINCFIGRKNQRLGFARVDFAHPISVREFQEVVMTPSRLKEVLDRFEKDKYFWMTDGYCNAISSNLLNWDDDAGSVSSLSSVYGDTDSMSPTGQTSLDVNHAIILTDTLTSHTVYDALKATTLMSTHLLSFLLLTRYRQGATMEILVRDLNELIILFRARKTDVGFYKKSELNCVIRRAADLLGPTLIEKSAQPGKSSIFKPNLDRSSLIQLAYYSNHVIPFLAMEGIIATALFAMKGPKLKLYVGTPIEVYVNENDLCTIATQLVKLLKAEFLLHPPCQQLEEAVKFAINKMRDEYLLVPEMRVTRSNYDDDDLRYDGGFGDNQASAQRILVKAVQEPSVFKKLCQVRDIIIPYVQVYVEAFLVLYDLLPPVDDVENASCYSIPELDLREKMLRKVLQVSSIPQEVVVMDTMTNFLVAMKETQVIVEGTEDDTRKITCHLTESSCTEKSLDIARNSMLSFLSF